MCRFLSWFQCVCILTGLNFNCRWEPWPGSVGWGPRLSSDVRQETLPSTVRRIRLVWIRPRPSIRHAAGDGTTGCRWISRQIAWTFTLIRYKTQTSFHFLYCTLLTVQLRCIPLVDMVHSINLSNWYWSVLMIQVCWIRVAKYIVLKTNVHIIYHIRTRHNCSKRWLYSRWKR